MDDHEKLAWALFTLAGRNHWNSAPEKMRAYFFSQADKLEKMLGHVNWKKV